MCTKATRWVVYSGNRVNPMNDNWISNMRPLREIVCVPLNQGQDRLKVFSFHLNDACNLATLSFSLPNTFISSINNTVIYTSIDIVDKLIWRLTSNGQVSTKLAYSLIETQLQSIKKANDAKHVIWKRNGMLPTRRYLHLLFIKINHYAPSAIRRRNPYHNFLFK